MTPMRMTSVLIAAVLVACGGGKESSFPDADPSAPDCTGVVYDNCRTNDDCMSGNCHVFNGEFSVCTQACTAGDNTTCPLSANGLPAKCNNRGICKPNVNNACKP